MTASTTQAAVPALAQDLEEIIDRDLPWESLSGCRVVVTGAGGFLGSYLVRTLLALYPLGKVMRPLNVVAMVRDLDRARVRFDDLAGDPNLEMLRWDLNDIAVPALGSAHYVLHAASQASPRYYGADPVGTILPNVVGTAALLEALRLSPDPRGFLFVSSSEVYGAVDGTAVLAETDYGDLDPATVRACYAESKRLGETLCVGWHAQHGLPAYIVRPFHTYGPGLTADDGRVFSDFAQNAARGEHIVMASDGSARRAFCYVSDAVAGFFTVLLKGVPGVPYNVANASAELSVVELAELVISLVPEKRLRIERRARATDIYLPSQVSRVVPNTDRLQGLGWAPRVESAAGFARMVASIERSAAGQ